MRQRKTSVDPTSARLSLLPQQFSRLAHISAHKHTGNYPCQQEERKNAETIAGATAQPAVKLHRGNRLQTSKVDGEGKKAFRVEIRRQIAADKTSRLQPITVLFASPTPHISLGRISFRRQLYDWRKMGFHHFLPTSFEQPEKSPPHHFFFFPKIASDWDAFQFV